MAFLLPAITAISGAVGIATGIKSLFGGGDKQSQQAAPTPKPLPDAPKVADAQKKAQDDVKMRRVSSH